jgi:hypothetical protein
MFPFIRAYPTVISLLRKPLLAVREGFPLFPTSHNLSACGAEQRPEFSLH